MFEAHSSAGTRLVAGWATASEVMHGQRAWTPGSSPWVLYDVAAPRPAGDLFIGLNVHGTSAQQDRNPDNWIVVLAAPSVRAIGWTAPGTVQHHHVQPGHVELGEREESEWCRRLPAWPSPTPVRSAGGSR